MNYLLPPSSFSNQPRDSEQPQECCWSNKCHKGYYMNVNTEKQIKGPNIVLIELVGWFCPPWEQRGFESSSRKMYETSTPSCQLYSPVNLGFCLLCFLDPKYFFLCIITACTRATLCQTNVNVFPLREATFTAVGIDMVSRRIDYLIDKKRRMQLL